MQTPAQLRAISVGEPALLNINLRKQRHCPPSFGAAILAEDVVLHNTTQHGQSRFFQITHVMAVVADEARQFLYGDRMLFLGFQFIVGIIQKRIPCSPLEQGDIVLYLDRRAMLDDFPLDRLTGFRHQPPPSPSLVKESLSVMAYDGSRCLYTIDPHPGSVYLCEFSPVAVYLWEKSLSFQ